MKFSNSKRLSFYGRAVHGAIEARNEKARAAAKGDAESFAWWRESTRVWGQLVRDWRNQILNDLTSGT